MQTSRARSPHRLPAALLGAALLLAAGPVQAEVAVRLAPTLNPGDARNIDGEGSGELVAGRSDSALQAEVVPSSRVAPQTATLGGKTLGLVEMNIADRTHPATLIPAFPVVDLPFRVPDADSVIALIGGQGGTWPLDMLPGMGLRGLARFEVGLRHRHSNVPVTGGEERQGAVIRVPGKRGRNDRPATSGARSTPMSPGWSLPVIGPGVVLGAGDLIGVSTNARHQVVADKLALIFDAALPSVPGMSEPFWRGLSPEHREVVQETAALPELAELGMAVHAVGVVPLQGLAPEIHARHASRIGAERREAISVAVN